MAKIITLAGPAIIGGALRTPADGPMTVWDETAAELKANGQLAGEPDDLPDDDPVMANATPRASARKARGG